MWVSNLPLPFKSNHRAHVPHCLSCDDWLLQLKYWFTFIYLYFNNFFLYLLELLEYVSLNLYLNQFLYSECYGGKEMVCRSFTYDFYATIVSYCKWESLPFNDNRIFLAPIGWYELGDMWLQLDDPHRECHNQFTKFGERVISRNDCRLAASLVRFEVILFPVGLRQVYELCQ